jgi:hypothetical protein
MSFRKFDVFGVQWRIVDSPDVLRDDDGHRLGTMRCTAERTLWIGPGLRGRDRDLAIATGVSAIFEAALSDSGGSARLLRVDDLPLY